MSKLQAALAWASRGFPVFPLIENAKLPLFGDTWYETATTDEATIRAYWTDPVLRTEHDYNIGMDCTGRIVVDIDVKNGKDGYNQYMQLGGSFDTLVVQTPTGGYHCYFEGPDAANVNIAKDIEIRSHHGYVVAPGSTIDGVPYAVVRDGEPAWVNLDVEKLLQPVRVRREHQTDIELDSAANIQAGINYLQTTPIAIEGQRGDETTFITAARLVRELGLSTYTAFELMRDHWNERCSPPWQLDELLAKVENASEYGTAELGRLDPSVVFAGIDVPPPPSPLAHLVEPSGVVSWGNALDPQATRPRPWIVDRLLMAEKVSMIGAQGSAGKSSLGLALAAHLSLGLEFAGHKVYKRHKVIVYNGEDDKEEQSRRLQAVCMAYHFDYNEVRRNIIILSYEDVTLTLVAANGSNTVRNDVMINSIIEIASDPEVGVIILDPLVDLHSCNESDSGQMNVVMRVLQDIAKTANVAVLVMHHTTKAGSERQEQRIGNMDIFRGASGIVFKCRAAFTLMDASSQDAEEYGMQDHERHMWTRLDDAKMNNTLKGDKATWFRKVGVKIMSGDVVGVLHAEELTKNVSYLRIRLAELLVQTMLLNNSGSMPMSQAVNVVRGGEPLLANKKDLEIRARIEAAFINALQLREHTIKCVRETVEGKSDKLTITLT